jgi:hypothetical protein
MEILAVFTRQFVLLLACSDSSPNGGILETPPVSCPGELNGFDFSSFIVFGSLESFGL